MGFVAELAEVRGRLMALGQRFDPALISAVDAEKVLEESCKIANAAHALTRSATARAADVGAVRDGERDRDSWIGRKTGRSTSKAKAESKTEDRLRHQPAVAAAARSGELSPEQTEASPRPWRPTRKPSPSCWPQRGACRSPSSRTVAGGLVLPATPTPTPPTGGCARRESWSCGAMSKARSISSLTRRATTPP